MTDILPPAGWLNVRQLETNEFATGGANGNMNEQAKSLAARSELLKQYAALPYESKTGGYALNERVQLATGDIVRSTIPSNVNNPNVDMTGWVKVNAASQIFDESGLSQQEINNARLVSLLDFGAKAGGVVDALSAINSALSSQHSVIDGLGRTYKVSAGFIIPSGKALQNLTIVSDFEPLDPYTAVVTLTGGSAINITINPTGKKVCGVVFDGGSGSKLLGYTAKNCQYPPVYFKNSPQLFEIDNAVIDSTNCQGEWLGGAIQVDGQASNGVISNSIISEVGGKGFVARYCNKIKFLNCVGLNCDYENFSPNKDGVNLVFENCKSYKDKAGISATVSGMKASRGAYNVEFNNCTFQQLYAGTGVVSAAFSQGCSWVTFDNCFIESVTEQAVLMSWHPEDGAQYPATPANHIRVKNCRIKAPSGSCVRADPSYGFSYLTDIIIDNNNFESWGDSTNAIRFIDCQDSFVRNNRFYPASTNTQPIVLFYSSDTTAKQCRRNEYTSNKFFSAYGNAIRLFHVPDSLIAENTIIGTLSTATLVSIEQSANSKTDKNTFSGVFNTAVTIEANSLNPTLSGNTFDNPTATAVRQNSTGAIIVSNVMNVSVPCNPIGGGSGATYIGNTNYSATYGSSAPTTGTWKRGDVVWNASTGSGLNSNVLGWICTAAGTQGTWQTMGIVGVTKMPTQANSTATDVAGIVAAHNALLALLKSNGFMS